MKSYVSHQWDGTFHTTSLTQRVTVYRVGDEGRMDASRSLTNGEIYNREGYYTINAKCTTEFNDRCLYKCGCAWPGYQAAVITLQRDAKVRVIKKSGVTEAEYHKGDTFMIMDEEAFLLL